VLKTTVTGGADTTTFVAADGSRQPLQRVFAATFRSPGSKTISTFIVNDSETVREAEIDLSTLPKGTYYLYELNQSAKDRTDVSVEPVREITCNKTSITLLPESLVLVSGYKLVKGDKGITVD
jgi:hypothetical protein